jgi:hypothetical protein
MAAWGEGWKPLKLTALPGWLPVEVGPYHPQRLPTFFSRIVRSRRDSAGKKTTPVSSST